MNWLSSILAIIVGLVVSSTALALPGAAPAGSAIGEYDPLTGHITVSVANVNNWFVQHDLNNVMTEDTPLGLPAGGGTRSDSDKRIGETGFMSLFSYTNVNLGFVAETGLADDGNLNIYWNTGLGSILESQPLVFASDPNNNLPLRADINGPFVIDLLNDPLNLTLDASDSTGGNSTSGLTYSWDLDNDDIFEIDGGTSPILEIADVSSTFGGHGLYNIATKVFDGVSSDIDSTTLSLFTEPIVPADAQYDPATGKIVVSVFGVDLWVVRSTSSGLTGDEPIGLPAGGSQFFNTDQHIGEMSSQPFQYDLDLGYVAQAGLPEGDLELFWRESPGSILHEKALTYVTIPEPTGLVLLGLGLLGVGYCRGRRA